MAGPALTRTAQALRLLLEVAPGAGHTVLAKLAYLADLLARQHLGRPITGMEYTYDNHGPFDRLRFYAARDELEGNGLGGAFYLALYVMAICAITILTHVFLTPETRARSLD